MNSLTQPLDFSILLPVCHGGKFLQQSLRSLQDINFPRHRFEILVAGLKEDEQSKKIVESEAALASYSIRYIECSGMNRAGLLNRACSIARGAIFAFADDDCIFFQDWLRKLEQALKLDNNIGVIGGEDNLIGDPSSFDLALDYVLNSFLGTGGVRKGQGSRIGKYYPKLWNMAIPRDVAISVAKRSENGSLHIFDESLDVHEDVDLANRIEKAGKRVVFVPEVRIGHYRDTSITSFFLRNMAMARTCKRLGVHRFPHTVLSILTLSIVMLAIFSPILPHLRNVFGIVTGIYVAILLVSASEGFIHTRRWSMLVMVPVLLVSLHVARGLGHLFPWNNKKALEKL